MVRRFSCRHGGQVSAIRRPIEFALLRKRQRCLVTSGVHTQRSQMKQKRRCRDGVLHAVGDRSMQQAPRLHVTDAGQHRFQEGPQLRRVGSKSLSILQRQTARNRRVLQLPKPALRSRVGDARVDHAQALCRDVETTRRRTQIAAVARIALHGRSFFPILKCGAGKT